MGRFIGVGAYSGPWELVDDSAALDFWTVSGPVKLKNTAANPATTSQEDEYDVTFNIAPPFPGVRYGLRTVHCEITNWVLHDEWKGGFDTRFQQAKSLYVHGWLIWDTYYPYGAGVAGLELHPLREVRFSVPSEGGVQYRCLFMDTSNRFHKGFRARNFWAAFKGKNIHTAYYASGEALAPWKSERGVASGSSDSLWMYRQKQLRVHQADFSIKKLYGGISLESTAHMKGPKAALVVQSASHSWPTAGPTGVMQVTRPFPAEIATHQRQKKYRHRFQFDLGGSGATFFQKFGKKLTWELVPGPLIKKKSGFQKTNLPTRILVDVLVSSKDIQDLYTPLAFESMVTGKQALKGLNRTLPPVPPFDSLPAQKGPEEEIFLYGHREVSISRPGISLVPGDEVVLGGISKASIGLKASWGFYRSFQVKLHKFPVQPKKKNIAWKVYDQTKSVPFKVVDPYRIRIDTTPASDQLVTVEVTVTDEIGAIYTAKATMRWHSQIGPRLFYDIGLINPLVGPDPVSLRSMLLYGTPLTVAAARVVQGLHAGEGELTEQALGQAFQTLGEEIIQLANLAAEGGLSPFQTESLTAFFGAPGRTDARLPTHERLGQLAEMTIRIGEALLS